MILNNKLINYGEIVYKKTSSDAQNLVYALRVQTMKPKTTDNHPDLFRSQLSQIINLSHPLCRLADKINWDRLEGEIDQVYGNGCRHPSLPTRFLAGLHYLKHTFDQSDEDDY